MAFQHHNDGMSPELRKLFESEMAARERFKDQVDGVAQRKWSDGRVGPDDDGDLAFTIRSDQDRHLVFLDFGQPVEWVGMPPHQAVELAQTLIKHARAVSTEPIRIVIN